MYNSIFALPVKEQLSPSITLRQMDELPIVVIDHPQVKAAVTLQGAHLVAWQPKGEEPVLWLSDSGEFKEGMAIRGGVPICWPWFGKAANPNHGIARILPWTLDIHQEDAQQVTLEFGLHDSAATEQYWPKPFALRARYTLGKTCGVELNITGDFQNTTALHSYFNIKDITNVSVSGLGNHYIDKVNGGADAEQHGDVTFAGEVDRIYTHPQDISLIHDKGHQRVIEIHHHNHSDVVAWNAGAELARKISDISDEGYKTYVCVETARVNQQLVATPAAPARLSVVFSVSKG